MSDLRVLVVDDSPTVRHRLVEILSARAGFEVVGQGEDGRQAIELCLALKPDVMTLDMAMPRMSGLSAVEYIMAYRPTPILMVSSSTNRGELFKMYDALSAGAVDILEKPSGDGSDGDWEDRFAAALRLAARVRVITHPRARLARSAPDRAAAGSAEASVGPAGEQALRAVFIGASTGGPGAVRYILRELPADFPLPIVLVVHLAKSFGSALAEWLDGESPLRVAFARDGESLPLPGSGRGRVLLAPPDRHLVLRGDRLALEDSPELHSCRPSVDRLFGSVATELGPRALGLLMTGMGKDGAEGLLAMRRSGAMTVAQDEASCVIYGMPREAVALGAAQQVLSLDGIAGLVRGLSGARL